MIDEICPVCAEGTLTDHIEPTTFDEDVKVDMLYSICDTCGTIMADSEQTIRNRRAYVIAKGMYE